LAARALLLAAQAWLRVSPSTARVSRYELPSAVRASRCVLPSVVCVPPWQWLKARDR
jgi:hypothetical protein